MSETFDDERGEDFALVVSPLDGPVPAPDGALDSPGDGVAETAPSLRAMGAGTARRRRQRAGAVALTLALALVMTLAGFPGFGDRLSLPWRPLTPTPPTPLPLGSDIILLAHTVPWGEFRVNGRRDLAADLGEAQGYHSYRLPPGVFTLDYVAAPFPNTHCTLSVPQRVTDTCTLFGQSESARHPFGQALRALDMNATVATMDDGERRKLQALLEAGVSFAPISIAPGMHYLDANGNVAVATVQMVATPSVGAASPEGIPLFNDDGQLCGEFCALSWQDDPTGWKLTIAMELRWTYRGAAGVGFTARVTPQRGITSALASWANGAWSVQFDPFAGGCYIAPQIVRLTDEALQAGLDSTAVIGDAQGATGCVIEFQATTDPGAHPPAQVLFRLGLVLAVNAPAQRIFPDLPVATSAERALAQAIRSGAVQ